MVFTTFDHRNHGIWASNNIAHAFSKNVLFLCSLTPFWWGVYPCVNFRWILAKFNTSMKAKSKKFPTLIIPKNLNLGVESQFNTSLEMLKILQTSKFILHKINTCEPRKSFLNVTKNRLLPKEIRWISPKKIIMNKTQWLDSSRANNFLWN